MERISEIAVADNRQYLQEIGARYVQGNMFVRFGLDSFGVGCARENILVM